MRKGREAVRVSCAALVVLACLSDRSANAASRVCGGIVASAGEDRISEVGAKQKAMAGWIAAASRLGPAFILWRNAAEKSLSCLKLANGTWRCQAFARPCGITQVPGVQPPGSLLPQSPSKPKSKALEVRALERSLRQSST